MLSQAIDKAEVAAPLIVKNFNKIARAGLNIAAPSSVQVAAHFAAPLVQVPAPPPFQTRRRRGVGPDTAPMDLLNILTELVKNFNLTPGHPQLGSTNTARDKNMWIRPGTS